jgi:hypothetical protein
MEQISVRSRMKVKGMTGTNFPGREGYRGRRLRLDPPPMAITMRCENRAERLKVMHDEGGMINDGREERVVS